MDTVTKTLMMFLNIFLKKLNVRKKSADKIRACKIIQLRQKVKECLCECDSEKYHFITWTGTCILIF